MSKHHDDDQQHIVFDGVDDPIVADPDSETRPALESTSTGRSRASARERSRLPTTRRAFGCRMTGWDISPFEQAGLRVASRRPPVLPEVVRDDEDPSVGR